MKFKLWKYCFKFNEEMNAYELFCCFFLNLQGV